MDGLLKYGKANVMFVLWFRNHFDMHLRNLLGGSQLRHFVYAVETYTSRSTFNLELIGRSYFRSGRPDSLLECLLSKKTLIWCWPQKWLIFLCNHRKRNTDSDQEHYLNKWGALSVCRLRHVFFLCEASFLLLSKYCRLMSQLPEIDRWLTHCSPHCGPEQS